jgi:hypothetical protein
MEDKLKNLKMEDNFNFLFLIIIQ